MHLYSLGGFLAGLLVGIVLAVWAAKKHQKDLAAIGLSCCVFFGSIGGLILIIPIVAIFLWLIWRANNKSKQVGMNVPNKTGDDKFYDEVARELQEKPMVPGLWTKAFAEMGGDDAKARALYIKYRVAQLTEASRQELEKERLEKQRQEERNRVVTKSIEQQRLASIEAAKRQSRTGIHRFIYLILAGFSGLITISFIFFGLGAAFVQDTTFAEKIYIPIFSFFIAVCFGIATNHCSKQ